MDVGLGKSLLCERGPEVLDRDLFAALEHATLVTRYVDQDAARKDRFDVLDAELPAPAAVADLRLRETVVIALLGRIARFAVLGAHVAQRIELGAVLRDVTRDVVLVPEELVVACRGIRGTARHEQRVLAAERRQAE